jgi:hypothetical protein
MYKNATYLIFLENNKKNVKKIIKQLGKLCIVVDFIENIREIQNKSQEPTILDSTNETENDMMYCTTYETSTDEINEDIDAAINKATKNKATFQFDDNLYPEINTLYIHLFNGLYYNDKIYSKKKLDMEREMLLLLAGKLGVRLLTYTCVRKETTLTRINAGIKAYLFNTGIKYNIDTSVMNGCSGKEVYLNRGAPVYLFSRNISFVNDNIQRKLSRVSNIFPYDYYIQNQKLSAFVYKRFVYHMLEMDYTIEVEDISDKSFGVAICFMENGLQIKVNKRTTSLDNMHYHFEFFTDAELISQTAIDNELSDRNVINIMHENLLDRRPIKGHENEMSPDEPLFIKYQDDIIKYKDDKIMMAKLKKEIDEDTNQRACDYIISQWNNIKQSMSVS